MSELFTPLPLPRVLFQSHFLVTNKSVEEIVAGIVDVLTQRKGIEFDSCLGFLEGMVFDYGQYECFRIHLYWTSSAHTSIIVECQHLDGNIDIFRSLFASIQMIFICNTRPYPYPSSGIDFEVMTTKEDEAFLIRYLQRIQENLEARQKIQSSLHDLSEVVFYYEKDPTHIFQVFNPSLIIVTLQFLSSHRDEKEDEDEEELSHLSVFYCLDILCQLKRHDTNLFEKYDTLYGILSELREVNYRKPYQTRTKNNLISKLLN